MLSLATLTLYQQLLFIASNDSSITTNIPRDCELKYLSRFVVIENNNRVVFIRTGKPDTVEVSFEFNTDPRTETFVKVKSSVSITIKGTLLKALAELRHFINREVMPTSYSGASNYPVVAIRKLIDAAPKYLGRVIEGTGKEQWDIDIRTIVRLDKIFTAVHQVALREPGMAWLIENHTLHIHANGTDRVYIDIQNADQKESINFECPMVEDEFDFYIQLHKTIKQKYPTNPLFRCTIETFRDWEEALYTAITTITGKAPYMAVVKATDRLPTPPTNPEMPACIYGNQIFIDKE